MNITKTLLTGVIALGTLVPTLPAQMADDEIVRLAQLVRRQIVTLSNYGLFDDINFGIRGDEVILRGYASRPALKRSAEKAVARIEGVEKVTNEIEVLPTSPNDDRIRILAYREIYGDAILSRYNPNRGTPIFRGPASLASGITQDPPRGFHPIHIIVNNGDLTLTGVVESSGHKAIAEIRANQVDQVFKVTNELSVEMKEEMGMMKDKKKNKKMKK